MLKSFALQNFQSFREKAHISLDAPRHSQEDGTSCISPKGSRLSKCLVVAGANASGKTSLIKSIAFVNWFAKYSFHVPADDLIPLSPHFSAEGEPCVFELDFELDGQDWRYRLSALPQRVIHESLHLRRTSAFSYVFTRDWDEGEKSYLIKQNQFKFLPREAKKVRENASLLSTAAQYNVPIAQMILRTQVNTNLFQIGRYGVNSEHLLQRSAFYANNPKFLENMTALLKDWDFGLSGIHIKKEQITTQTGEVKTIHVPYGIHQIGAHEHALAFYEESSGTQGAFILLSYILPALQNGGLVVVDELEADLHPHMLVPILDLFLSQKTNPRNAQIIFTSHSIEVLNLLKKTQIVLVEKDKRCESKAWRLDSMQGIRSDDNFYAKYMAGAYGAVPLL